jgi:hypothetical protein
MRPIFRKNVDLDGLFVNLGIEMLSANLDVV